MPPSDIACNYLFNKLHQNWLQFENLIHVHTLQIFGIFFQNCVQLDIFNTRSYSATICANRIGSQPNHKSLFKFEFDFPTLFLCDQNDKFD